MNAGDLLALKEILGHSSMVMVERYAHLASAYKRRQINNLGDYKTFDTKPVHGYTGVKWTLSDFLR
jgi:hypothetical protein